VGLATSYSELFVTFPNTVSECSTLDGDVDGDITVCKNYFVTLISAHNYLLNLG
jgi:hypothetical protein